MLGSLGYCFVKGIFRLEKLSLPREILKRQVVLRGFFTSVT